MKLGIVIPAYNVGDRLCDVLSNAVKYIPRRCIYVVDDGSTDATAEVASREGVVLLQHRMNKGKGEALKSGFRLAKADGVEGIFMLDGDGQHDPNYIPDFISSMEANSCDVVVGVRRFRIGEMPLDRIFSNRLSSMVVSALVGQWIPDSQCGYRLFRTVVIDKVSLCSSYYEFETEFLVKALWSGFRISYCPIAVTYDGYRSHIRRFDDTKRFCRLMIRMMRNRQQK